MRESTTQLYIDAHDAAWDDFIREWIERYKLARVPPSKWEAFTVGFAAGVQFGRNTEAPGR